MHSQLLVCTMWYLFLYTDNTETWYFQTQFNFLVIPSITAFLFIFTMVKQVQNVSNENQSCSPTKFVFKPRVCPTRIKWCAKGSSDEISLWSVRKLWFREFVWANVAVLAVWTSRLSVLVPTWSALYKHTTRCCTCSLDVFQWCCMRFAVSTYR